MTLVVASRLPRSVRTARLLLLTWIVFTGLLSAETIVTADPPASDRLVVNPRSIRGGLVVSVDPEASRIGAEILARGGNAVDAAVATAFALAVTFPEAGNIGGGGFMLVRLADTGECFGVDYRESAPRRATPNMFLDEHGNVDEKKVDIGWLVVGVPGTPHGLWTAHEKCGRLPWRDLVAPAVALAEEGFVVNSATAAGLKTQESIFRQMGEPAKVYFDEAGKAPSTGSILKLPDLAESLRLLMEHGPAGFYKGPTADRIDAAMKANGGLITKEDLDSYRAVIREPVRGTYRGYEILSMSPPSSGGVTLLEMLGMLEGFDFSGQGRDDPRTIHLLAEAMKRAYYDRAKYLADPDFVSLPLDKLLSREHASAWRQGMGERATPSASFGADILTVKENDHTTHFSVIDADGNMVANTYTLEGNFGAKVIAPGTGFLLNNEMHDFNVKPGTTNSSGLIGTPPNTIEPGKRMLSSQTPTLVLKDGKPFLILGSPGGRTIINTVLQVLLNVVDHQMDIQSAVDAPRIHHAWLPDAITVEPGIFEETRRALTAMGHSVKVGGKQGDCQAILIDPVSGERRAGIDRRRLGGAVGVPALKP